MKFIADDLNVLAITQQEIDAYNLFCEEWKLRTGFSPRLDENKHAQIVFKTDETIESKDTFIISFSEEQFTISAKTIRGLIFGYSLLLRKTRFRNEEALLTEDICGIHTPQKRLRGHQVGYRTTPNTYDAWDYDQYFRCQLDLMAFGANIIEHNGSHGKGKFRNRLMKYEQMDFLTNASSLANEVDIDVSLWQANEDDETQEQALQSRDSLFSAMKRLDYLFIPGGDPGSLQADEFLKRSKLISHVLKKHHPEAEMHVSAQAPHCYKDWGEIFVSEIAREPAEIDTIIMGPNHAYPMHELRKKIPSKYPLRFYPDITHNLRCEYPVNFQQDDWHFAFCNTLSRESVNPRPVEMRALHRIFSQYTIGSVSYSEGVHDDVNKAIWSALEWNKDADLREILLDYARFFIYGTDENEIADIIFLLEKGWQGDPVENPCVDIAYNKLCKLLNENGNLKSNWRFMELYFRGCCDMLVKMRRVFENQLCKKAYAYLKQGKIDSALEALNTDLDEEYYSLRNTIDTTADTLFNLIGLQLDVEHYCADSWERGATLETIDNNVSDKAFLISKLEYIKALDKEKQQAALSLLINRSTTGGNEIYYSVALHNLNTLGVAQNGEFYMDIQGDRPYTKANPLPMSMTKVYDHFSFNARFGGFLENTDYVLTVVYKNKVNPDVTKHTITVNGSIIYQGTQFGGENDQFLDKILLPDGFVSASYPIESRYIKNGTIELCISEEIDGVNICELWLRQVKN